MVVNVVKPSGLARRFSDDIHLRPLSVDEYLELVRIGFFGEDEPLELIEGWLVRKMTKNQPHVVSIYKFTRRFVRLIPDKWTIGIEQPIATATSAPEPDVSVVRGEPDDYAGRPAPGSMVSLVVEISESSLRGDREDKLPVYAEEGIPVYWIVNLLARQIEVYTEPQASGETFIYGAVTTYADTELIPLVLDDETIATLPVSDLLP